MRELRTEVINTYAKSRSVQLSCKKKAHAEDAKASDQGRESNPLEPQVQVLFDLIARLAAERWLFEKQVDCPVQQRSDS